MAQLMLSSRRSPLPQPPSDCWWCFNPTATATQEFLDDFARALGNADSVILAPIYTAGEPIDGQQPHLGDALQRLIPDRSCSWPTAWISSRPWFRSTAIPGIWCWPWAG